MKVTLMAVQEEFESKFLDMNGFTYQRRSAFAV